MLKSFLVRPSTRRPEVSFTVTGTTTNATLRRMISWGLMSAGGAEPGLTVATGGIDGGGVSLGTGSLSGARGATLGAGAVLAGKGLAGLLGAGASGSCDCGALVVVWSCAAAPVERGSVVNNRAKMEATLGSFIALGLNSE